MVEGLAGAEMFGMECFRNSVVHEPARRMAPLGSRLEPPRNRQETAKRLESPRGSSRLVDPCSSR